MRLGNSKNSGGQGQEASQLTAEALQAVRGLGEVSDQIDQKILQLIDKIFAPPAKGIEFIVRFLAQAEVKQNVLLPNDEMGEQVAIVTLKNVRELAKRIHWGYDTTHKYVVVMSCLNLLFKRRTSENIQLIFPLQGYAPPSSFQALDHLIHDSRPKVQQFARRIRQRCALYNIVQGEENISDKRYERQLIQALLEILQSEGVETELRRRIIMRFTSEILNRLLRSPDAPFPSQAVDSKKRKSPLIVDASPDSQPAQATTGRLSARKSSVEGRLPTSTQEAVEQESPVEGRLSAPVQAPEEEKSPEKGRLATPAQIAQEKESPVEGRLADSAQEAVEQESPEEGRLVDSTQMIATMESSVEGRLADPTQENGATESSVEGRLPTSTQEAAAVESPEEGRLTTPAQIAQEKESPVEGRLATPAQENGATESSVEGRLAASTKSIASEHAIKKGDSEVLKPGESKKGRRPDFDKLLSGFYSRVLQSTYQQAQEGNLEAFKRSFLALGKISNQAKYTKQQDREHSLPAEPDSLQSTPLPTETQQSIPVQELVDSPAETTQVEETPVQAVVDSPIETVQAEETSVQEPADMPAETEELKAVESTRKAPKGEENTPAKQKSTRAKSGQKAVVVHEMGSDPSVPPKPRRLEAVPEPKVQPAVYPPHIAELVEKTRPHLTDLATFSQEFVASYVTLNVIEFFNKLYFNSNVTLRKELARFLAEVFGEKRKVQLYLNMMKKTHPDSIVAAFVHVMHSLHSAGSETIHNKAALFFGFCKQYQQQGITAEASCLVEEHKERSLAEFYVFLLKQDQERVYPPSQQPLADPSAMHGIPAQPGKAFAMTMPTDGTYDIVEQNNKMVYIKTNFPYAEQYKRTYSDACTPEEYTKKLEGYLKRVREIEEGKK